MNSGYRCLTAFLMIVLALGLGACAGDAKRTGWLVYETEPAGDGRVANVIPGLQRATGFGSVHDVPRLPTGFTDVFESWYVEANGIRLHAVIGGEGRPLLLLSGWPQNWFAWRYLMLPLAKQFSVIAVDPRGVGLSDKATTGYDSKTLAIDMFALMAALGHKHFAMVGHDIGMWTGYAMAADQPGRIKRIALGEAIIPGVSPSPPLLSDDRWLSDFLWHFNPIVA